MYFRSLLCKQQAHLTTKQDTEAEAATEIPESDHPHQCGKLCVWQNRKLELCIFPWM